jgi:hypothetical protein
MRTSTLSRKILRYYTDKYGKRRTIRKGKGRKEKKKKKKAKKDARKQKKETKKQKVKEIHARWKIIKSSI